MQQGITESRRCRDAFEETKIRALNAGVFFIKARAEVGEGEFNNLILRYEERQEIGRSTVYRYIQFTEGALEWAAAEHPELRNKADALLKAAYKVVLQSPKAFVALMRQLGEMRKFGEYDSVKYATRKLGSPTQIEFHFDKVFGAVDLLSHLGDANYQICFPTDKDETEALKELRDKLRAGVERLDQIIERGHIIET